jgi:DNA polymerase-3 subunit alpha
MTALLTAESRGTTGPAKNEKIAQAVAECKRLDVKVLPPDINKSDSDFSIEDGRFVRFGLSAVKNVGSAAIESILQARSVKKFSSLQDFCARVNLSSVNKKTIESLIKAGAMDAFGNRASLLISLPDIASKANTDKKNAQDGQGSLFGDDDIISSDGSSDVVDVDDFSLEEKLNFEKEFLGFYLTSHHHLDTLTTIKKLNTHEIELLVDEKEGTMVKIGGILENTKKIFTKKSGAEMAFLSLGDEKGITIECVVFPKIFEMYRNLLISDNVIVVEGRLDQKNDKPVIITDRILSAKSLTA